MTVTTKVSCVEAVPSLTVAVIVAVPFASATGVIVAVQFGYAHQKTTHPFGISEVLLLVADTLPAQEIDVSISVIVNEIPVSIVSSSITWSEISLIIGVSLSGVTVTVNGSLAVAHDPSVTVRVIKLAPF